MQSATQATPIPGSADWTLLQSDVVQRPASTRLVVRAGPGTGKTAVACARLAWLIEEEDVWPDAVWLISFTRTAVAEIRRRLECYLGSQAASVRVATLDSWAWKFRSGFDGTASLEDGFDQNISDMIEMLKTDHELRDAIARAEHVVIDEAQDIVGVRSDLVEALLDCLDPRCGVTVFADPAQAIYGFANEDGSGGTQQGTPLTERLMDAERGFAGAELVDVHRTASPGLLKIFKDVRTEVLEGDGSVARFEAVRTSIGQHSDERDLVTKDLDGRDLENGTLVLFRTRAEALRTAQFYQGEYSLRLSGYGAVLPAWLAMCLFDFEDRLLNERTFTELWEVRIAAPGHIASATRESAWKALTVVAGEPNGTVSMKRLRSICARSSPPVELAEPEYGLPGPVFGTIHASKGREADDTILFAPKCEDEDSDVIAEETRVLFVGATRARQRLLFGDGKRVYSGSTDSGRLYSQMRGGTAAMIEFGRSGDLSFSGLVGSNSGSIEQVQTAQAELARIADRMVSLKLTSSEETNWRHVLTVDGQDVPLGLTSKRFKEDIWEIVRRAKKGGRPASNIKYVRSLGCRTVVIPQDDPQRETLHTPWRDSGFLLMPKMASFTKVFLGSRR